VTGREMGIFDWPLLRKACTFATAAHAAVGQHRKYTDEPYIVHPAAVAKIVGDVRSSTTDMVAAAWLHDVVEDTKIGNWLIAQEFGDEVARLVYWLTDVTAEAGVNNRQWRKKIDCARLSRAPEAAQTIKLADLYDNTLTIEERDHDFAVKFRREKRDLLEVMTGGDAALRTRVIKQITERER
jgi:(p)ppGpp synthase/HD superfamily hydrolase